MLPMIISIRIPHMLHLEGKLFESLGCLVLVRKDCIGSREFTIYEMRKGCSVWSIKYVVNTDDFMNPLLEGWSIRSIVWSIVLGEREEDSFLMSNLSAKIVLELTQENTLSKTPSLLPPLRKLIKLRYLQIFAIDYANDDSNFYGCVGLRLAFNPIKSPYYKVVRAGRTCSDIVIEISHCSEKGNEPVQ
ncbi:hypothetical protein Tco_1571165 [Tanacetum coccineum]